MTVTETVTATPSPSGPDPSVVCSDAVLDSPASCASTVSLDSGQWLVVLLFLGSSLVVSVAAFVRSEGRALRV